MIQTHLIQKLSESGLASRALVRIKRGRQLDLPASTTLVPGSLSDVDALDALLRGAVALGLRPHEFWALTPAEFRIVLRPERGAAPLARTRLEELAAAFPDRVEECEDG